MSPLQVEAQGLASAPSGGPTMGSCVLQRQISQHFIVRRMSLGGRPPMPVPVSPTRISSGSGNFGDAQLAEHAGADQGNDQIVQNIRYDQEHDQIVNPI